MVSVALGQQSAAPRMPLPKKMTELSLDMADRAGITVVEDHPENTYHHDMEVCGMTTKAERLMWHQSLATVILSEPLLSCLSSQSTMVSTCLTPAVTTTRHGIRKKTTRTTIRFSSMAMTTTLCSLIACSSTNIV